MRLRGRAPRRQGGPAWRWAAVLVLAAAAAGCSRQDAAWRQAESEGTDAAYLAYLETYPDGVNASVARDRLAALREDREWSRAERIGTPESYQRFLARHPEGARAAVARERLGVFHEPPPPAPVVEEPATPVLPAEHWLQLGAFVGGEAAAGTAWQRLSALQGGPLAGLAPRIVRARLPSGDLWRLFAGPVDAADGETRCAALRQAGESCLLRQAGADMNRVTN
jgi:hypothetical protein